MSATVDVTKETFKAEVIESDIPVIVDFWGEGCGPCVQLAPVLEEIAAEYDGRVKVAKVDVYAERELAFMYQVMQMPTVMTFKGELKLDEFVGALPKQAIIERLQQHI